MEIVLTRNRKDQITNEILLRLNWLTDKYVQDGNK